ncbi:MAG: tetratricopeptide repeat protein, partial [Sandaracinaceae bacterium]|nr:tetratricopeptide repeat protein [Sandaracinaceae bacterium]
LPEVVRRDPSADGDLVDPTPADEVGPSAALEPAQPLDLDVDPRTGRVLPPTQAEPAARGAEPRPPPAPPSPATPTAQRPQRPPTQPGDVVAEPLEPPGLPAEPAQVELAPGQALEQPLPEPAAPAPPPPTTAPETGQALLAPQLSAPTPRAALSPSAPAPSQASATEGATEGMATDARYERGLQRYRSGDFTGAAEDFSDVVRRPDTDSRRLLPSALHQLARSHGAAGACRAAVGPYESLLSRYPTYPQAGQAMMEAADCYRRIGQMDRAHFWLERAQRHPVVAPRAEQELARMRAVESQRDRAATSAPPATEP